MTQTISRKIRHISTNSKNYEKSCQIVRQPNFFGYDRFDQNIVKLSRQINYFALNHNNFTEKISN